MSEQSRIETAIGATLDNCELFRAQIAEPARVIASLRQHKNEYMDAAEVTRKALLAEIATLKAQPSGVVLPAREWLQEGGLVYSLEDGANHYEINVTQAGGSRETVDRENLASKIFQLLSGAKLNPTRGVPEGKEFSQFLSAVMDAAGLVRHGRQSKELSEYLGSKCMEYMLSTAPSQPDQCDDPVKVPRELPETWEASLIRVNPSVQPGKWPKRWIEEAKDRELISLRALLAGGVE